MKSLTLFKQTKHIQLGHMYEHIFCDRVVEYLFDKNVYASVDYTLDGKMYHGGVMVIEFAAYTKEAEAYINDLISLPLTINEGVMLNAWNQVESEKQWLFGHSGFDAILSGLKKLEAMPWQTFEELDVIDVNDLRRQAKPFYVATDKVKSTKPLVIDFFLDDATIRDKRALLPLANRLFGVIGTNLQFFLTRETGIFFDDESIHYDKKSMIYRLTFKTYPGFDFTDEYLRDSIVYVIKELHKGGAFSRLCRDLRSITPSTDYWSAPPIQWVYESTYQVVGLKGWKRLATEKNVRDLLYGIHVEAKFGKRRIGLIEG